MNHTYLRRYFYNPAAPHDWLICSISSKANPEPAPVSSLHVRLIMPVYESWVGYVNMHYTYHIHDVDTENCNWLCECFSVKVRTFWNSLFCHIYQTSPIRHLQQVDKNKTIQMTYCIYSKWRTTILFQACIRHSKILHCTVIVECDQKKARFWMYLKHIINIYFRPKK